MANKKRHPVIDKNLQFIRKHLKTHTLFWISKQIGINPASFYRYAKVYGFIGRDMRESLSIEWTPEMIKKLKRFFPTTFNRELAESMGISPRTLIRKARSLGLQKQPDFLDYYRPVISRMARIARPKNDAATIARITEAGIPYRFSSTHRPKKKVDGKKIWETRRANELAIREAINNPY